MLKRVFLAINLPDRIKKEISFNLEKFKSKNDDYNIRWTSSDNYHLTIHFFGNVSNKQIALIERILSEEIKNIPKFKIKTGDVGYLPNKRNPRIIYVEIIDIEKKLKDLVCKVEALLDKAHFSASRKPWKAHLSIARIKNYIKNEKIYEEKLKSTSFKVKSVELMESHLNPTGSVFNVITSFGLKK